MATQTIDGLLAAARAQLDRLDPAAAQAEVDGGALIVDTRCAEARRERGVIPGSIHIPLSVLYWRFDPTSGHNDARFSNRDGRYLLVCADGYSSSLAAATLRQLGFPRATDLDGGFNGWAGGGFPVRTLSAG